MKKFFQILTIFKGGEMIEFIKKRIALFSGFILFAMTIALLSACHKLTTEPSENKVTYSAKIDVFTNGPKGILQIARDEDPILYVYEEYVSPYGLFCCIWPPKADNKFWDSWPPWRIPPFRFPFPWPIPDPLPPLYRHISDTLAAAIHTAPIVFLIELDEKYNSLDSLKITIKANYETYSGYIQLWDKPYTTLEFYKFIKRNTSCQWDIDRIPRVLLEKLADETGFSKNSLNDAKVPEETSFGVYMLWESGIINSIDYPKSEAKSVLMKVNWGKVLCVVGSAASDLLANAGAAGVTAAVGAVNVAVLKEKPADVKVSQ